MNPLNDVNKEALRRLREYDELMKKPGYQQLVDEITKAPSATIKVVDELTQASKLVQAQFLEQTLRQAGLDPNSPYQTLVSQVVDDVVLKERDNLSKLVIDMTKTFGPSVYEKLAAEVVQMTTGPAFKIPQKESARVALEMTSIVRELNNSLAPKILNDLQFLSAFSDAPLRLAMATMQSLKLDSANPLFSEFISHALSQPETLTKKKIQTLEKEHLSKKRIRALTTKQQIDMMKLIAVLSLFVMIYTAWKMGQPVTIDPNQITKLSRPPTNITVVIQSLHPETHYLVMRDCKLVPKPGKTPIVIYALSPGAKVKLITTNHQWIYVHYEEGDISKEGWVRKKYLTRLPTE